MRIVFNAETCSTHGACIDAAPDLFEWAEDDTLRIKDPSPPESMRAQLEDAVTACPTQSLSIAED